jgi:hypothetical protein
MTEPIKLEQRVLLARLGGMVERCHILPHAKSYSNAAHSWGVAMLMLQLWPEDFPRLAGYCLCHDVPEAWVGDIPAHTKHRLGAEARAQLQALESGVFTRLQLPDENELSISDQEKLKACDALDLWLWARDEMRRGNYHAEEVCWKLEFWFRNGDRALPSPADEVWRGLQSESSNKYLAMENY